MSIQVKPAQGGVFLELSSDNQVVATEYVPNVRAESAHDTVTVAQLVQALDEAQDLSFDLQYEAEQRQQGLAKHLTGHQADDNDPAIATERDRELEL